MRFRRLAIPTFALIIVALGLSGCGQKGPLVPPKAQFSHAPAAHR